MTDRNALADQNETPEDVATLYSWANLHGAKYRDFSVARAQTREKARLRVQEAIESERRRVHDEAEQAEAALQTAEAQHTTQQTARKAELAAVRQDVEAPPQAAQPRAERFSALPPSAPAPYQAPQPQVPQSYVPSSAFRPAPLPQYAPLHDENFQQPRNQWAPVEPQEDLGQPAWLAAARPESPTYSAPQTPEDTLQGSGDRLTSRWFALKGVFDAAAQSAESAPVSAPSLAPVLAIFSLAGGVGKTSLVATLGRALSARGERVLLVDTAAYGLLPFFFGARDQRPGQLRTFAPPASSGDAPVQMVAVDPETMGPENAPQEVLTSEIGRYAQGVSRVLVDLATASGATTRRVLRLAPTVLVPIIPDMNSVVSVSAIEAFFQHNSTVAGKSVQPFYVLNQFDPSLPLHLDVRELLREQLGDRLLPFALRRAQVVSEALAEGMTVMDYAPSSSVAEDFGSLAGWVKSLATPASGTFRGVRWSER